MLVRLKRACDLGYEENHCNSERWCVKFSTIGMPYRRLSKILRIHSNNYVRARPAAIKQRISFGTGIAERSCAYAVLLRVFI